jgi:tRNA pseudouridine55 synthase
MITDGIININKEQNMTSHDVVGRVRKILNMKKVGHTGTLDPMATGVLPVCLGRATRIIEYLDLDMKGYLCTMKLGLDTDTMDIWGNETARTPEAQINEITEGDVMMALDGFRGPVSQIPPAYSAIKVNGRRLYDYARSGETVDIPSRDIYITDLYIEEMELGKGYDSYVTFYVECTKGTYIRSICHDIGEVLGVHGVMTALERTDSGVFSVENSVTLDELADMSEEELEDIIRPAYAPLVHFGEVEVDEYDANRLVNGLPVWTSHCSMLRRPEYEMKSFLVDLREDYKRAYNVFGNMKEGRQFIGVAFTDETAENIIPEKIFYSRGQQVDNI